MRINARCSLMLCLSACASELDADQNGVRAVQSNIAASAAIGERLRALPGVAAVTESGSGGYTFTIDQPIDHSQPALGTFKLRVQLKHRSETAPTVLQSSGYSLFSRTPTDSEPSSLLSANSVSMEQRFFGPSTPMTDSNGEPSAEAWQYMTVKQAAADTHHVVELLKQLYPGPWISTGASKGGQVAVYHYRFYTQDLVGVVAYVGPNSFGTSDPRYVTFLDHVGDAGCRDKLIALQRDALMRRSELLPRFQQQTQSQGLTFEAVGIEAAYEHVIQEFPVAFWQYGKPADCNTLPAPGGSSTLSAITKIVPINLGADQSMRSVKGFETYYYQAAVELGQYGALEEHLTDLLEHPGSYRVEKYAPQVPSLKFNPATVLDIDAWVKHEAEHILFVYGENDPWTAGAFEIDPSRDLHLVVVPEGNHGSTLTDRNLPAETRALALQVLERWTGVKPRSLSAREEALRAEGVQLFQQVRPRFLLPED